MSERFEFLDALSRALPEAERMITCGFTGDPNKVGPSAWKPRPWRPGEELDLGAKWNGYVTVSSFSRAQDGTFRRRGDCFAGGRALMVDDVGTKVDAKALMGLAPSARIETSPGNEQWWYFLEEPEREMGRFDGLIRAFISGKLLGADPGMSGVTRVGRIPGFQNDKEQYGGWTVKLNDLNDTRFTPEQLLQEFGLRVMGTVRPRAVRFNQERSDAFVAFYKFLEQRHMLKRHTPDLSGWTEMTCPWVDSHTQGADTGAAIREPYPENEFYGAFRCHHGHCADKGWAEMTDWINELATEELNDAT
jgi:hypothetical protein